MDPVTKRTVIKYQGRSSEEREDLLAVEKKLVISVQGKEFLSLYCTPIMVKELLTGLFMTEGIVTNKISMEAMNIVYGDDITVTLPFGKNSTTESLDTARCLGGFTVENKRSFKKIYDDFSLTTDTLHRLFHDFQHKSDLFKMTGCFHSAAISDKNGILSFAEDIGRHNAVDKVLGDALLKDVPLTGKALFVSCRISSEIVSKCSRWCIPILASRSAPTDLAREIAEISGITLIGFLRGDRLNIYSNPQRIIP
jgi:FdhD protein